MAFQTPSWPRTEQTKKPVNIQIPQVMGRRSFLTIPKTGFIIPTKRIDTEEKLEFWKSSEAYFRLIDFITLLNESVKNKKLSDKCFQSEAVERIVGVLDQLGLWIDEFPPDKDNNSRFGNIVFRSWIERLHDNAAILTAKALGSFENAVEELAAYLKGSFGDGTRLDYGSGHELSFAAWICCFELLGVIKPQDYQALVVIVFAKYLKIVRKLQSTYNLEPAGSHGIK
jgi:serine/threonine-protein phosphatase 2A activator